MAALADTCRPRIRIPLSGLADEPGGSPRRRGQHPGRQGWCSASSHLRTFVPALHGGWRKPDCGRIGTRTGFQTGAFQLFRLVQFATLFWLVCQIPLTRSRTHTLLILSRWVLVVVSVLIIATFSGIIAQSRMVGHLSAGAVAAGPWQQFLSTYQAQGLGAVGYNHAYVAAQVTVLLGLCLLLSQRQSLTPDLTLIALSTVAVTLTGSRAGLLAHLLFVVAYLAWRSLPSILVGGIVVIVLLVGLGAFNPQLPSSGASQNPSSEAQESLPILQRQRTAFNFEDKENLSGRDSIWKGESGCAQQRAGSMGHGLGVRNIRRSRTRECSPYVATAVGSGVGVSWRRHLHRCISGPAPCSVDHGICGQTDLLAHYHTADFIPIAGNLLSCGGNGAIYRLVPCNGRNRTSGQLPRCGQFHVFVASSEYPIA